MEARVGFEPTHRGFADLSLSHLGTAPSLPDRKVERAKGLEPSTFCLASRRSTAELRPPESYPRGSDTGLNYQNAPHLSIAGTRDGGAQDRRRGGAGLSHRGPKSREADPRWIGRSIIVGSSPSDGPPNMGCLLPPRGRLRRSKTAGANVPAHRMGWEMRPAQFNRS